MDEELRTIEDCLKECEGLNHFAAVLVGEVRQAHAENARLEARIRTAIGILRDTDEREDTR